MSIQQFEAIWTEKPTHRVRMSLLRLQRQAYKSVVRTRRRTRLLIMRQYYITNALRDSSAAFRRNEDIMLASLIIIAVVAFSASSILTNVMFQFMLSAAMLSALLGGSMVILVALAFGVLTMLALWLVALLQNALSISLIDGATGRYRRSLLTTWRRGLQHAPATAIAWIGITLAAFVPAGIVAIITAIEIVLYEPTETTTYAVAGSAAVACVAWIIYVLCNYSLLPYILLFTAPKDWRQAITASRVQVSRKGRMLVLSSYMILTALILLIDAFCRFMQRFTGTYNMAALGFMVVMALLLHNACLTMLYRKRRLARK